MLLTLEGRHTVGRALDDKTVERAGRRPAWWGWFFLRQDEVLEVNSGDLSTPGLRASRAATYCHHFALGKTS